MRRVLAGLAVGGLLVASGCSLGSADGAEPEPEPTATTANTTTATTAPTTPTTPPTPTPSTAPTTDEPAQGQVVRVVGVIDGDTLRVSVDGVTEQLRIIGIDAPELRGDECFAQRAASRMQSLVQSRDVRIIADPTQDDRDRYDRILRHVLTLEDINVAETLVAEGLAKEYTYDQPYAGRNAYLHAQDRARDQRVGIWSGACDVQAAPTPTAALPLAPSAPGQQCLIKGNISRSGERIYHLPDQRHYEDTIIDAGAGERWFCTEDEAVSAGWRKSKR